MYDQDDQELQFVAAALFDHLHELGDDAEASYLWSFGFSSASVEALEAAVEQLGETTVELLSLAPEDIEFMLAEETTFIDEQGAESPGPPFLSLEFKRRLLEAELAEFHRLFQAICNESSLDYEGVSHYDLSAEEEFPD